MTIRGIVVTTFTSTLLGNVFFPQTSTVFHVIDLTWIVEGTSRTFHFFRSLKTARLAFPGARKGTKRTRRTQLQMRDKSPKRTHDWLEQLKENGFVVINDVIPSDRLENYRSQFWDWMESFKTGIDRNDRTTWTNANWPHSMHGLLQHFGIGHALWVWTLRTESKILEIFARIWNVSVEELLCSFDGANLTRPTNRTNVGWEHLDQGSTDSEFKCVQGCMVLQTCNGGLKFYKKSNKKHKQFFKESGIKTKGNWYKLNDSDKQWYLKHCTAVEVPNVEGTLVLWDSRTVHWGYAPTDNPRMCVYVSYLPRSRGTAKQLDRKLQVFNQRRMTSHWAVPCKLFSETFQHYGHPELLEKFPKRPTIIDEEMTPEMWRLVGVPK